MDSSADSRRDMGGQFWEHWLPIGGPDAFDRERKRELAELTKDRKAGTKPTLPLTEYAGTYRSTLYSKLDLTVADDRLQVRFGDYTATLDHWDNDTFYGRAVIEPWLDWHVKFDIDQQCVIRSLEIVHLGWKDPDERFDFKPADK